MNMYLIIKLKHCMNRFLFLLVLTCTGQAIFAQYVYTIKADSVKITNSCDTAELIIENHTQTVPGFLFNKGRGRTEFRKVLQNLNDNTFLIGGDTMKLSNVWLQGGNSFGSTGLLGTKDNYPLTFLQNGAEKGRIATSGNWLFNSIQDRGYLAQFNGNVWTSGTIYTEGRVDMAIVPGSSGDNGISIGRDMNVYSGLSAIGLGQFCTVTSNGYYAFGVGRYNTVNDGIGILGSTYRGIAIGMDSYAGEQSIAFGAKTTTTAVRQFVCGGLDAGSAFLINDIYFGSGVQRNNVPGDGFAYTINGSGAYGANYAGGDIAIAGGKGTGAGTPGSIIFATAQSTSSGTTLQALSERARIDGNGNFGIGNNTPSAMLHVSGTGRFDNTVTTSGHRSAIRNVSGNTTIGDTDEYIFVNTTSMTVTITLPTATGRDGQTYTIKKINEGSNPVTIANNSSQLIDGMNSYSLSNQWAYITVVANGNTWMIVSKN
jgi:hypothetical protein